MFGKICRARRLRSGTGESSVIRTFYQREHQRDPQPETLTMFSELYAEASKE
jgi:hypothetical protein